MVATLALVALLVAGDTCVLWACHTDSECESIIVTFGGE